MIWDLKLGVRSLLRQPSFTLAAGATLALGIAGSTAVFSTVNAALLEPLPYPDAESIYSLRTKITDGRYTSGLVGPVELLDLTAATDAIAQGALGLRRNETLVTDGGAFQTAAYGVSRDFFRLFGARRPMSCGTALQAPVSPAARRGSRSRATARGATCALRAVIPVPCSHRIVRCSTSAVGVTHSQHGRHRTLAAGPDVVAYTREHDTERVLIVLNIADAARELDLDGVAESDWRVLWGTHRAAAESLDLRRLRLHGFEALLLTDGA